MNLNALYLHLTITKHSSMKREIPILNISKEIYDAWLPEGYSPARATSEAKLADPLLLVEIIVTAALKD